MPSKMATCCKEKAVLVAVYVETPRKRRLSSNNNRHHHHHHHHLHQPKHVGNGGGYNRRADLLDYSRRLRESARSGTSSPSPSLPKPVPSNNQPPMKQIISVQSKPKQKRVPTCLGNLKLMIPSFLRSLTTHQAKKEKKRNGESTAIKMKGIMKSFQVQKKGGFLSKLFAALKKHR